MQTPVRKFREKHLEDVAQVSTPLNIPASPFMQQMGFGTCVNVYRLDRPAKYGVGRSPWAIKRTSKKAIGKDVYNERIRTEAEILKKLKHPNIVGFREAFKSEAGVENLALEFCNISLGMILEERFEENMGPLEAAHCNQVIVDIAQALDYLHTQAKLLHGDLKSHNVLIKGEFEICKLCDFGVSLPLDENGEVNFDKQPDLQYIGTPIWSAPEIVDNQPIIDAKADIFSFGMVIYETLALVPPHTLDVSQQVVQEQAEKVEAAYKNELSDTTANETNDSCIDLCSDEENFDPAIGTRPPLPKEFEVTEEYNRIVEIFYCCTNHLPEDRPTGNVIWKSFA